MGSQGTRQPGDKVQRIQVPVTQKKVGLEGKLQGPDRRTLYVVSKESAFYTEVAGQ